MCRCHKKRPSLLNGIIFVGNSEHKLLQFPLQATKLYIRVALKVKALKVTAKHLNVLIELCLVFECLQKERLKTEMKTKLAL